MKKYDFDPVNMFKKQIQEMCERSFQQIKKKNQITRMLITNLAQGTQKQSQKIQSLAYNIKGLENQINNKKSYQLNNPLKNQIHHVIQDKDNYINQVLKQIISRLNNFQQVIKGIPRKQKQWQKIQEYQSSINSLESHMRTLTNTEDPNYDRKNKQYLQQFDYKAESQKLHNNINTLESILNAQKNDILQTNKELQKNLQVYRTTIQQPLNMFDTNLTKQNQQNQKILKAKLSTYATRIKNIQNSLQKISIHIKDKKKSSLDSQRKFQQGLKNLKQGLNRINQQFPRVQKHRNEKIQDYGNYLDEVVQKMLQQTMTLNKRVNNLQLKYENEIKRIKQQLRNKGKQYEYIKNK